MFLFVVAPFRNHATWQSIYIYDVYVYIYIWYIYIYIYIYIVPSFWYLAARHGVNLKYIFICRSSFSTSYHLTYVYSTFIYMYIYIHIVPSFWHLAATGYKRFWNIYSFVAPLFRHLATRKGMYIFDTYIYIYVYIYIHIYIVPSSWHLAARQRSSSPLGTNTQSISAYLRTLHIADS